jgi:hypothetical protein
LLKVAIIRAVKRGSDFMFVEELFPDRTATARASAKIQIIGTAVLHTPFDIMHGSADTPVNLAKACAFFF